MSNLHLTARAIAALIICCACCSCGRGSEKSSTAIGTEQSHQSSKLPDARIEIDAAAHLRTIPKELFGTNIEWLNHLQQVFDVKQNAVDSAVENFSKEMRVSLIRFPGGTFADYYHWKAGVGPVGKRQPQKAVINDGEFVNYFGTDELMQFCKDIGAHALLTINMITDNEKNAAAWVDYCNNPNNTERAQNGHPTPYTVSLWELGNESYMKADNPKTRESSLSPEEYAQRCTSFISEMKKVDPSIKVAAIGGSNFARYGFLADSDWNKKILGPLQDKIDFLALHTGYAPLIIENDRYTAEEVYSALLAFPKLFEQNLLETGQEIDKCAGANSSRIKIAITEWGPLFHVAPSSPWVDHPKTLASGLYTASILQAMIRNPRVTVATFFKLKDVLYIGSIGYDDVPKSSFYSLKLYSAFAGSDLVASKSEGPKYRCKAMGLVPEIQDVPYLDTIAIESADRKHLTLSAVNKSLTEKVTGHIHVKHFLPAQKAHLIVFTSSNFDANNGKDLPDVPGFSWAHQVQASLNPQFYKGKPGTLELQESSLEIPGADFDYEFAPHSVTAIELRARDRVAN
ncbi:MAG: hypothetical protein U0103_03105 [Candidatus Obscuribacterales bacterium]